MARWHRRMTILRFHTPLIEPDRRISRIRLSDKACVIAIFPLRRQRRLVHGGAGRLSGVSQPVSGVNRLAPISKLSSPSALGFELRPLPSTGVTRRPRYDEPLRHPRWPGLSLTGVRLRVTRPPPLGVSRVALDLLVPTCRHHYPGGPLGSDRSWDGLLPAKTTASGRVTRRASSDPACFSHSGQGLARLSHDIG